MSAGIIERSEVRGGRDGKQEHNEVTIRARAVGSSKDGVRE